MKIKKYIAGSVLFFTILACVVPGLSQPAPSAFDPSTIPTMVALTADAAMTQTAVALPTPAQTPTRLPPTAGTNLEGLPDGSTKFADSKTGFEVIFPAGWLTLRSNSEEFNLALLNEAANNEFLRKQMEFDKADFEPEFDCLNSYPLRPDLEENFVFGYAELELDTNDPLPFDSNFMGELVRDLESSGIFPGFRAETAQIYENENLVNLLEVSGSFSMSNSLGEVVPHYHTSVYFKPTANSSALLSFTYLKEYQQSMQADVKSIITSIRLLNQ
jgi:hypothetical protein